MKKNFTILLACLMMFASLTNANAQSTEKDSDCLISYPACITSNQLKAGALTVLSFAAPFLIWRCLRTPSKAASAVVQGSAGLAVSEIAAKFAITVPLSEIPTFLLKGVSEDTTILQIPGAAFRSAMQSSPAFAQAVTRVLAGQALPKALETVYVTIAG